MSFAMTLVSCQSVASGHGGSGGKLLRFRVVAAAIQNQRLNERLVKRLVEAIQSHGTCVDLYLFNGILISTLSNESIH